MTREQMAAFLSRGLGRTALGTGEITFEEADEFYVAVVDIDTGGTSRAGLGFININATVTLFTDIPGLCPCSGIAYPLDDATNTLVGVGYRMPDSRRWSGGLRLSTNGPVESGHPCPVPTGYTVQIGYRPVEI